MDNKIGSSQFSKPIQKDSVHLNKDSFVGKLASKDVFQILPGEFIGEFKLKEEVPDKVLNRLGRADSSDAAMCKSWAMWYWEDKEKELDLYSVCDPDFDMRKILKIIRLKGVEFVLKQGNSTLTEKSNFAAIKIVFENGAIVEPLIKDKSDNCFFQDVGNGIAFELSKNDAIQSVLVFPKGESIAEQYLPIF